VGWTVDPRTCPPGAPPFPRSWISDEQLADMEVVAADRHDMTVGEMYETLMFWRAQWLRLHSHGLGWRMSTRRRRKADRAEASAACETWGERCMKLRPAARFGGMLLHLPRDPTLTSH
jgi:hypothetical protein